MTQRRHKPIATPRTKSHLCPEENSTMKWGMRRHEDSRQWLEEQFSKRRSVSKTTKFWVSILFPIWRHIFVFCESLSSTIFSMSSSVNEGNLEVMFLRLHWLTAGRATQSARTWHDYPQKSCTAVIHHLPVTLSVLGPWEDILRLWLLYNLQLPVLPVENRCLARNSSVIIDLQDNYPIMTSPEELSGKTAVLCAEGYLESSQIQDADSNTFMGIRDM